MYEIPDLVYERLFLFFGRALGGVSREVRGREADGPTGALCPVLRRDKLLILITHILFGFKKRVEHRTNIQVFLGQLGVHNNITTTMKADYTLFVGGGQHYRRTEIKICGIHSLTDLVDFRIIGTYAGPHRIPNTHIVAAGFHLKFLTLILHLQRSVATQLWLAANFTKRIHHKVLSVGRSRILLLFLLRLVVIAAVVALIQVAIANNGKYNKNNSA